jgi:hypothetical protein
MNDPTDAQELTLYFIVAYDSRSDRVECEVSIDVEAACARAWQIARHATAARHMSDITVSQRDADNCEALLKFGIGDWVRVDRMGIELPTGRIKT